LTTAAATEPVISEIREMAIPHARPGEVIDVRPLGAALVKTKTETLVKTESLEVIRIVLPAGKDIARHDVPGEITVQCLEGNVEFRVGELKRDLTAGNLLYLEGADKHSLHANVSSSLLVTILLEHKRSTAK
jgi:quercetin dioxygenase-like cupin family protein